MKKLFLIAAITFIGLQESYSQTINDIPFSKIDVEYVQIMGVNKFMSSKLSITLDFGQHTKLFGINDVWVKDENGDKIEFNSMVDALNFMGKNGYDFVTAYTVTIGNQNVYY